MKKVFVALIIAGIVALIVWAITSANSKKEEPIDTSKFPDNVKIVYADQW